MTKMTESKGSPGLLLELLASILSSEKAINPVAGAASIQACAFGYREIIPLCISITAIKNQAQRKKCEYTDNFEARGAECEVHKLASITQ